MAEKIVRSLLKLNRKNYQELYNMNPVLRDGEPVVCVIPASQNAVQQEPCIMLKIGDGTTAFRSLPWISGLSADIYDWALQAQKPVYVANEICFQDGESFQQKYDNGELTGPAGQSGVYIGTSLPSDPNIKVWIDPSGEVNGILPPVSAEDNGKFLCVVNGNWAAHTVPNAEGVGF